MARGGELGGNFPLPMEGGDSSSASKETKGSKRKGDGAEQAARSAPPEQVKESAKAAQDMGVMFDKLMRQSDGKTEDTPVSLFSRKDETAGSDKSDKQPEAAELSAEDDAALKPTAQEERDLGRDLVEAAQQQQASAEAPEDAVETAADEASAQLLGKLHEGLAADTDASASDIIDAVTQDALNGIALDGAQRANTVDMSQFAAYNTERDGPDAPDLSGSMPKAANTNPLGPGWEQYNPAIHNVDPADDPFAANAPPVMPGGGVGGMPPRANFAMGAANPNAMPPLGAVLGGANRLAQPFDRTDMSRAFWGGAILGGIVGVAVGRGMGARRERVRSAAAREKLEKQFEASANALQFKIAESDAKTRALARQVAAEKAKAALPTPETAIAAPAAVSSAEVTSAHAQPGHAEAPKTTPESARVAVKEAFRKKVNQMSREELLEASEHVVMGNKNMRELVDQYYIDIEAAARVLETEEDELERHSSESVRKHAVEQALAAELTRFELDPLLKDRHIQFEGTPARAQTPTERQQDELAPVASSPVPSIPPVPAAPLSPAPVNRSVPSALVTANIVAATILGALLVILAIIVINR